GRNALRKLVERCSEPLILMRRERVRRAGLEIGVSGSRFKLVGLSVIDRLKGYAASSQADVRQEIDPIDQFHGDETLLPAGNQLIKDDEVGMRYLGQGAEFLLEAIQG